MGTLNLQLILKKGLKIFLGVTMSPGIVLPDAVGPAAHEALYRSDIYEVIIE